MPEVVAGSITRWDVVLVFISLITLVGIFVGWFEKLAKPLNALNITNTRLADCVGTLEKQLNKLCEQNEKEHDEIWCAVDCNNKAIQEVDKRVLVIETKESA